MKINLHIENLILHGIFLTPTDCAELTAAIQREFSSLMAAERNSQPWIDLDGREKIQAQMISYEPGGSSIRLGQEIAESLYNSLQSSSSDQQSEVI